MRRRLIRAAAIALAVACVSSVGTTAAHAAQLHAGTSIRAGGTTYVLDTYNTSMSRTKVNADCIDGTWWTHTTMQVRNASTGHVVAQRKLEFYHYGYLFDYFISSKKHRGYNSLVAFKKAYRSLLALPIETVKQRAGIYCIRDLRRDETKGVLGRFVKQMESSVRIFGEYADVSKAGLERSAANTVVKFRKTYAVSGTWQAWQITTTDLTDGYRWTYDSTTTEYTERKV